MCLPHETSIIRTSERAKGRGVDGAKNTVGLTVSMMPSYRLDNNHMYQAAAGLIIKGGENMKF